MYWKLRKTERRQYLNPHLDAFLANGGDTKTIEQGSELWKQIRLGSVTASNIIHVMAKGKSGEESATRYKYKVKLMTERMTWQAGESYLNAAMEWGIEQERFAVMAYEAQTQTLTDKTGFWLHHSMPWVGVSPDRLVGDDGLVEVKCPNSTTHVDYLIKGVVPSEYSKQIQMQLWVTERQWCDFVSYDPRLPSRNQLLIVRAERDEEAIAKINSEVRAFLAEIDVLISKLGA